MIALQVALLQSIVVWLCQSSLHPLSQLVKLWFAMTALLVTQRCEIGWNKPMRSPLWMGAGLSTLAVTNPSCTVEREYATRRPCFSPSRGVGSTSPSQPEWRVAWSPLAGDNWTGSWSSCRGGTLLSSLKLMWQLGISCLVGSGAWRVTATPLIQSSILTRHSCCVR